MQGPDSFQLLRLLAASFVLWYHSYALSGVPGAVDPISSSGVGVYAGLLAVYLFFAISGFLVTASWLRRASLLDFLLARATRIVPALVVCVVACAYLLGPAMTLLPLDEYLGHPQTFAYVGGNLSLAAERLQFELPGVFGGRGVNGSLWTIPAEVAMYSWIALVGAVGLLRLPSLALLAVLLWSAAVLVFGHYAMLLSLSEYLPMAACFWLGALAWVYRERLVLNGWILVLLLSLVLLTRDTVAYLPLLLVALVYGSLWLAYVPRLPQRWSGKTYDYSYGIYLWGAPMQQVVVTLDQDISPTALTLAAWPLACALAIVSWHCVEQPAMRALSRRRGGRGQLAGRLEGLRSTPPPAG